MRLITLPQTPPGWANSFKMAVSQMYQDIVAELRNKTGHALATATNDFLVASGAGAFVKKTLAETKTILGYSDAASIDPGHKHSKLWASDGTPEAVTVDAAGNVGIGTVSPEELFHISGASQFGLIVNTSAFQYTAATWSMRCDELAHNRNRFDLLLAKNAAGADTGEGSFHIRRRDATWTNFIDYLTIDTGTNRITWNTYKFGGDIGAYGDFVIANGNVGIGTASPTSVLQVVGIPIYANNAAAVAAGLTVGAFYRTNADPDPVCIVH